MKIALDRPIRISIMSSPSHLPIVRCAAEGICRMMDIDEETSGRVILALDEALTNVIRHSYEGADDQPIDIQFTAVEEDGQVGLRITMRDYGKTFDPAAAKVSQPAEVRVGGFGLHIMNTCMDRVEYKQAGGRGMELTMTKYLPALGKSE